MVQIIDSSLLEGRFVRVERSTFTPIVHQSGFDVPLENVSSGNAYLIQRMIGLLGKMYSLHVLRRTDPADICKASGLLLIDEAENHLHPRWQKKFIPTILSVFPNLQLVASTHSPFIVSSVPNARVFTCTYDSAARACSVREENEEFARKPVDEILLTDAFAETQPFGPKITALLEERKAAIEAGDEATQLAAEEKLLQENPEAFRAFAIDRILAKDARK
jgi:predicted ATP-binding protein involved in virulence